jgi:hypothetical protein
MGVLFFSISLSTYSSRTESRQKVAIMPSTAASMLTKSFPFFPVRRFEKFPCYYDKESKKSLSFLHQEDHHSKVQIFTPIKGGHRILMYTGSYRTVAVAMKIYE